MTDIRKILFFKHLRSESNMHIRRFRRGRLIASGKGLAFWFMPMGASIAELPTDDRELQFIFKGRSRDFQETTIQTLAFCCFDMRKWEAFSVVSGRLIRYPCASSHPCSLRKSSCISVSTPSAMTVRLRL